MNFKKGKKFTKLKAYQIPDYTIKKNILDIKNQIKENLYFSKLNPKDNLNQKKILLGNYVSKKLTNNSNTQLYRKSYSINNKPIPSLFKSIINYKKSNISKRNSDKNVSNKILEYPSLNLMNTIKQRDKNKRPLSSYSNGNNTNKNKIIYKTLIDKNNAIKKNRPMSSNVNNNKINMLNGSVKYGPENEMDKLKYTIKLKNKSEIFTGENLRYNYNSNNLKNNLTPSYVKLNNIKNHFMQKSNRINSSNINGDKLKYHSVENKSQNNSNYIRKYFFYKEGKTKSVDYLRFK